MMHAKMKLVPLRYTASFFLENLSNQLYRDRPACLFEVLRNGVCACMPNSREWTSGVGDVEIELAEHPIAAGATSLIVLDHGRGFTPDDMERFEHLGASDEDRKKNPKGGFDGAAEKRQGRFAALSLNSKCSIERKTDHGFYIYTRTTEKGAIRLYHMIPALIAKYQATPEEEVSLNDPRVGSFKDIRGSFTAIVIPHSMYGSHEEIRRELLWRIPRKQEQMFRLRIGGKQLNPPPLVDRVSFCSDDGLFEAYIDRAGETEEGGVWITDWKSGLRIAKARSLIGHVPHPFDSTDIVGDLFVQGAMANQDTGRTGLLAEYLRSAVWKHATRCMVAHVPQAKSLLGEDDEPSTRVKDALSGLVGICNRIYGMPNIPENDDIFVVTGPKRNPPKPHGPTPGGDQPTGVVKKGDGNDEPKVERRGVRAIRIGDRSYALQDVQLDSRVLVMVIHGVKSSKLCFNSRYDLMPARRDAREEHILMTVLTVVGLDAYPGDTMMALQWAGDRRLEILGKKQ